MESTDICHMFGAALSKPHGCLRLNMRGSSFEMPISQVKRWPETRLARMLTCLQEETKKTSKASDFPELFFDRNPVIFSAIASFYSDGHLHLPQGSCMKSVEEEMEFWGLDMDVLDPCCWQTYMDVKENEKLQQEIKIKIRQLLNMDKEETQSTKIAFVEVGSARKRWKKEMWNFLTKAKSSRAAMAWGIFSALMITLSFVVICLESCEELRDFEANYTEALNNTNKPKKIFMLTHSTPKNYLIILDAVAVSILTFYTIAEIVCAPSLRFYFLEYLCRLKILAMMSLLPSWYMLVNNLLVGVIQYDVSYSCVLFMIVYFVRITRIMFIFRLVNYYRPFVVLFMSFSASKKELGLLVILMLLGMAIFGNLIYCVEIAQDNFKNIPYGFWWALVTMTTVGYGDLYPVSTFGYMVGASCAVIGLLIVAMPVPIISNNFTKYYDCVNQIQRLEDKKNRSNTKQEVESVAQAQTQLKN